MKKILFTTTVLIFTVIFAIAFTSAQANESGAVMLPSLSVTPNPYTFSDTYLGETTSADFQFSNTGTDPLVITDITFTDPAFSIDYTAFTIEPGENGNLPVHFNPLTDGLNECTMQIWSNDPVNNPYDVDLSGNGIIELNNGWQWINTGSNYNLVDINFPQGQNQIGYAVGETATYNGDGMVIKTIDGGDTWTELIFDIIPGLESLSFIDTETGFAAGWDGYMIKTTDGGNTWDTIVVDDGLWYIRDIDFWDANNGVVMAYDVPYVTQDGGETWVPGTGITMPCNSLTYADENTLFAVGSDNHIFKSIDGGYIWTEVYSGILQEILIGVDFLNADYGIAVGDYGYILTTTDGGANWSIDQQVGDQLLTNVFIWDTDTAYVCGTPELLFKSTNGGAVWDFDYDGNFSGNGFGAVTFTDNYTGFVCGSLNGEGIILRKEGFQDTPELSVTPNPFMFEDTFVGEVTDANFTFANTGTEVLNISDITFTNPAFSIDYTAFPIQPGESGDLPVHFTPDSQGLFEGTMQVWSNDPVNNPYDVDLSGNGVVELIDGWEWIETGFNYILMDIEFPEGQNQIGYSVGQSLTYNGVGVVIKTTDGGSTWTQLTPEGIPGLEAMSFVDLNTGYVAGWDGYLIKTTDGGASWDTLTFGSEYWETSDIEFWDENNGVLAEFYGTYVTTDGGQTWTLSSGMTIMPYQLAYGSENVVYAAGGDGVCKSVDGGNTWTEVWTGSLLLGLDFLNEQKGVVIGDYGVILQTDDGGLTWNMTQPIGDQLMHGVYMWDSDTTWICGTPERVYKTTDGGNNWNNAYDGGYDKALYRIKFTDNYTGFICGGSGGIVLRKAGLPPAPALSVTPNPYAFDDTYIGETTNASFTFANTGDEALVISDITFTDPTFSIDYTAFTIEPGESGDLPVKFTPSAPGYFAGTMQIWSNDPVNNPYEVELSGNGIVELIDGWQWIETGFDFILMDIQFPEGQNQIGYCVGQSLTYNGDGIVIKTTDSGQTWEQLTPDGIPGLMGMSFVDINTGYAVGWDDYVIKTTDGGDTWDTLYIDTGMFSFYADIEFYDENNGVALYNSDVYITSDGGESWTMGNSLDQGGYMIEYIDENTLITVGNENYISKSTDGGYNWTVKNSGSIGQVLLGVDFLNNQYGMAAGDYGNILTTTDGGETWTTTQPIGDQLLHTPCIWDEDTAWIVGTPELVYKSTDGNASWNNVYNGNFDKAFYRIIFTDNYTGFICGGSGGFVLRKEGLAEVPNINVSPDELAFEDTYVEDSATEILSITNTGFATLDISEITSTTDVFTVDLTSVTLEPGENMDLTVTFTPDNEGLFEGLIQFESNDPDNGSLEISVSGTGIIAYPTIEINTNEIIYDTTLVGEYSVEMLTISNTGVATLNVTDIISSNAVFIVNMTTFDIEPGESQDIEVTFTPNEQMMFEGMLQIENNDPDNSNIEVTLSGYGDIDTYIEDNNSADAISIYPNPLSNILHIENVAGKEIFIYNQAGVMFIHQKCEQNKEVINVSALANGTYILKVSGLSEATIKKIIISR